MQTWFAPPAISRLPLLPLVADFIVFSEGLYALSKIRLKDVRELSIPVPVPDSTFIRLPSMVRFPQKSTLVTTHTTLWQCWGFGPVPTSTFSLLDTGCQLQTQLTRPALSQHRVGLLAKVKQRVLSLHSITSDSPSSRIKS